MHMWILRENNKKLAIKTPQKIASGLAESDF